LSTRRDGQAELVALGLMVY